ncbi:MAG: ketopantoate reductase family protein [Promethearchaeota archaeon]
MSVTKLRIGIIGAGSIGSLFGGYIADIKSDIYEIEVIFFCEKPHSKAVNTQGLKIHKNQDVKEITTIKAYYSEKELEKRVEEDSSFGFDFIFLTTKTYDIEKSIIQYKKLIEASNWLVILQNGIGNEDIVINHCSKLKIIRAVTTNGALLKEPGNLFHTGVGVTKIGFPFIKDINEDGGILEKSKRELALLRDILNLASFETVIVSDIIKECWEKVFVNVGINAFGALTRLKNGQLLEFKGLKLLMQKAIEEAIQVAKARNIEVSQKDYITLTYNVAEMTAENQNSMLQDILNGMVTEIDFINGRILTYARELNIDVPVNELLTHLVKGLESEPS